MARANSRALPVARLLSNEPSERQVRWVMRFVWLSLVAFAVLVFVGNHVPPS